MKNKGLCSTCLSDGTCSFLRKFPVIECEEFDIMAENNKPTASHKNGQREGLQETVTYEE